MSLDLKHFFYTIIVVYICTYKHAISLHTLINISVHFYHYR